MSSKNQSKAFVTFPSVGETIRLTRTVFRDTEVCVNSLLNILGREVHDLDLSDLKSSNLAQKIAARSLSSGWDDDRNRTIQYLAQEDLTEEEQRAIFVTAVALWADHAEEVLAKIHRFSYVNMMEEVKTL
jgi:hypothetical protein